VYARCGWYDACFTSAVEPFFVHLATASHEEAMAATIAAQTQEAQEQLSRYRDLLIRWNQRFNLTAVTDPAEIDQRLIGDTLRLLPALDDALAAWQAGRQRKGDSREFLPPRLIDVGSGAGLPGLVLKIARPELNMLLLEATGKKVGFLEHAILELGLTGITAIHGRAEELAHQPHHRGQFDVVTARAVAALPVLMEICVPFLAVGGHTLFPKGAEIEQELAEGHRAAPLVGARIVGDGPLPTGGGESVTRLVIAVKIAATPDRYPRRSGIPAKAPLGRAGR